MRTRSCAAAAPGLLLTPATASAQHFDPEPGVSTYW